MQHFCFPGLGKKKLCHVLVFGNVCFNIVVRINHDNVASRGGCWTYSHHCQIAEQNPSKRYNGEFWGFVFVLDLYNGILCCGFLCARFISVSFRLPRRGLPRRRLPRPYRYVQANRLPRLQGYHTRATTLQKNFWVQAGYHTCG